jgi:hypothetical protein
MKINLFSVDLKLIDADDPAVRAFRVLEFNDGLKSGFTGYDVLGSGKMTDRIVEDYARLFPAYRTIALNDPQNSNDTDTRRPLLLRRGTDIGLGATRTDLVTADRMKDFYTAVNADLHFMALSNNKAYQFYVGERAGLAALFPTTALLPTHYKEAKDAIARIGSNDHGYVLKPVSLYGGTGVHVFEEKNKDSFLSRALGNGGGRLRNIWVGRVEPACLLQHRLPANPVKIGEDVFDGTMRVVFTVYGEESGVQHFHIHDAYWKLPERPVSSDLFDPLAVVSFSPSNMEDALQNKGTLTRAFDRAAKILRGDSRSFMEALGFDLSLKSKNIKSAAVAEEIKSWLFPIMQESLGQYFSSAASMDFLENTRELINHESAGYRGLGLMMATHPNHYPQGKDRPLDFHYPESLIQDLQTSKIHKKRGYIEDFFYSSIALKMTRFMEAENKPFEHYRQIMFAHHFTTIMFSAMHSLRKG